MTATHLVIVRDLLAHVDISLGVNHNLRLSIHLNHLRIAVGLEKKVNSEKCQLLTSQEWLINRARLPLKVASMIVSSSILNR